MATKSKQQNATELEAELVRLNALVRERREQLDRLKDCPNHHCPCRVVWRDVVEKNLATQVGKIRRNVKTRPTTSAGTSKSSRKSR